MKRFALTAAILASATVAAPAMAQDVGSSIMGNDDAEIGTVASNDGTTVVVDTGTHQVPLGTEAFAQTDGVWTLNTTKTDLDTAFGNMLAQQQAALDAALVVGATVMTADAQELGAITEIGEEQVLLVHADQPLALPHDLFALNGEGALIVLANMSDIMAVLNSDG